ncbi:MAG: Do family serine endopeptidase [Cytophagales bacterium]|nr:MAG: Do family serine endopeptidase [Cytophagales bacterium]
MSNIKQFVSVLAASILGGVATLYGYKTYVEQPTFQTFNQNQPSYFAKFDYDTSKSVVPEGLNFIYASDVVRPSVVHIRTYYENTTASAQRTPFDEMLREFYGDRMPNDKNHGRGVPQEASGSGVILSIDGYIATNNHVIEKADKIEVVLNDKRSYIAKLIGTDPTTDLALLKIEEKGLPFVKYGNSDNMRIGEWVLAVGNPFNLNSTVTAGIVSAKGRNINILRDKDNMAIESFIQTDAVVNPGNSGGALVNLKGELIGINTAIASPTGSYTGYSFAVPVTLVQKVMEDLLKHGQVQRALLGISIIDLNANLAKEKGIKDFVHGIYVGGVNAGSAAASAGIKEGDVITHVNGTPVNSASELQEIVARNRPGDKVKIKYMRNDKGYEVEATLKNKSGNTEIVKKEDNSLNQVLGADFVLPSKDELAKLNISNGVKVKINSKGKLSDSGVPDGFIITTINNSKVSKPEEVLEMLSDKSREGYLIGGYTSKGEKKFIGIGW